jgi:hypothetical protein
MIDEVRLRDDLSRLLTGTEDNIRRRCDEEPAVNSSVQERYDSARKVGRTGMTFNVWREGEITQAGVAWLLACVFVRFLEDNDLLGEVYLAGPGARLKAALDPVGNDREYLLDIFSALERLPGLKGLLDRAHNPLWLLGPDGDGAKRILDFFQSTDPDTGSLRHDFTDTARSTRFLGDLYQNISESARQRYALLQTPDFIVDFIMNRTLEPALKEFPLDGFRLIDPACGSGHFLLEAFDRLFRLWANREGDLAVVVEKTLDCVYGVDLNPYAAAIARFRLLIAALRSCRIARLDRAPDWQIHVVAGDSLLFGPNKMVPSMVALATEDPERLRVILQTQGYQVVVGNPPYINVQDPELRKIYRGYYRSCSGKYQLSVPFTELFFDLAVPDGHVGMITSNAFMKRSFGKKLIEEHLRKWDLTHIIDTSGVCIPWHGTPTTILFARRRAPVSGQIRTVRGIRGETKEPPDPARAPVWTAILNQVDNPGSESRWVSAADTGRASFLHHPWPMGGGGAAELKERLDELGTKTISSIATAVGITAVSGEDDLYILPNSAAAQRLRLEQVRPFLTGDDLRDWTVGPAAVAVWPHCDDFGVQSLDVIPEIARLLWSGKASISRRKRFGTPMLERGLTWYEWQELYATKLRVKLSIAFASVATQNHFVIDRGGNVLNRHAPVVKLSDGTSEQEHIALAGVMNSSAAGFWLRQVAFPKGGDTVGKSGCRVRKLLWDVYFEYDSTNVSDLPLPANYPFELASAIQLIADERSTLLPRALISRELPTRASLDIASQRAEGLLLRMVGLQEELDWHVYHLYGLLDESLTLPIGESPSVRLGERAFEIVMARSMEPGELEIEWFSRNKSVPRTTIPEHLPEAYRAVVQRRLEVIARDSDIALIEQPEYKRRWNLTTWEELEQEALCNWLLDRLEAPRYWATNQPALTSVARLADRVRVDSEFLQVAELYRGRPDFDVTDLVQELVARESVPFLPLLRYKKNGLRKRADWERTWELQRLEDAGEKVEIPVPSKYESADFLSADYWRLRGKLDVPKERWISYPYLERDTDKSPVIAWAGYNHGQQALALASYCYEMRDNQGWTGERLIPLLAGLRELQPWLDQWHNQIDAQTRQRMNEFIRNFFETELTQLEITAEQVRDWRPPARTRRGRRNQ